MKREIKFKALYRGVMYDVAEISFYEDGSYGIERLIGLGTLYPASEDIKGIYQYTGLKDKNDRKIYEGHILRGEDGVEPYTNHVQFIEGGFWLVNPFGRMHMPAEHLREIVGHIDINL